jgi:translation initiation factor 4G
MTHRYSNVQKKQQYYVKNPQKTLPLKTQPVSPVKERPPIRSNTYTRDFLLKLKDKNTNVPRGMVIPSELIVAPAKAAPAVLKPSGETRETYYRNILSLLNKLTPENFSAISEKLISTTYSAMDYLDDSIQFLTSVVEVIFEKAVKEPRYADLYSQLCVSYSTHPHYTPTTNSFKKLLLQKCQQEFESPPQTIESTTLDEEEIKNRLTDRNNGVPQFIGALFLHGLIGEKIIHYCLRTLLSGDESDLLKFASLMMLIGKTIDQPKAKVLMDAYFVKIESLSKSKDISIRMRFKLADVVDLRKNNWLPKRLQIPPIKSEVNKQLNVREGR